MAGVPFRASALRAARVRGGLTQEELARLVGVRDIGRISVWERGIDQPGPAVIPRLAQALGVDPSELFDSSEESLEVMRRAAGLTLMALGERTGLGYKRVRRIERGLTSPAPDDIDRLASTLGVTQTRVRSALQVTAATRKHAARAGP